MNVTLLIIEIGVLCYIITCLALVDLARKDFGSPRKKAIWGFVAAIPFVGFVVYFLFGARQGKRPKPVADKPPKTI